VDAASALHDHKANVRRPIATCNGTNESIKRRSRADYYGVRINDIYQVQRRVIPPDNVHLNIRRRDGGPILRDWRHFQQIKNELIGPECEAVELYPAESRLVDTSNKFHLWGVLDPTFRFPLGFEERDVQYEGSKETPGMRQRPL